MMTVNRALEAKPFQNTRDTIPRRRVTEWERTKKVGPVYVVCSVADRRGPDFRAGLVAVQTMSCSRDHRDQRMSTLCAGGALRPRCRLYIVGESK